MPIFNPPATTALTTPLTLSGAALAWDDLRIEPTARAAAGTSVPAFEKWINSSGGTVGLYLYSFTKASAGQEKELFFTMQMPHSWDGSAIYLHFHWTPESSVANKAVRWGIEYDWAGIGQAYTVANAFIYGLTRTPDDTDLVALKHYYTSVATLTPTGAQANASSVLIGRLFRDSANVADTYTGKAGLLYVDAHYRMNKLGNATLP